MCPPFSLKFWRQKDNDDILMTDITPQWPISAKCKQTDKHTDRILSYRL